MASGDTLFLFDALSNRPPAANYASVDLRNGFVVLDFDDSANESAQFLTVLPSHYGGGSLEVVMSWVTTSATTGNAKFQVELTRLGEGASLDSLPAADDSVVLTIAAAATSGELSYSQSSPIDTGAAIAGDQLLVEVTRLATDAGDTLVGDVEIVSIEVREA